MTEDHEEAEGQKGRKQKQQRVGQAKVPEYEMGLQPITQLHILLMSNHAYLALCNQRGGWEFVTMDIDKNPRQKL